MYAKKVLKLLWQSLMYAVEGRLQHNGEYVTDLNFFSNPRCVYILNLKQSQSTCTIISDNL